MSSKVTETIGVVAVVISVLFVAYELRQANKLATTNVTYDLLQQHNDLHMAIIESPEVALLIKGVEAGAAPDPDSAQYAQLDALAAQQHNAWLNAHIAWREGQISDSDYFEIWIPDVASTLDAWPGLKPHIAGRVTSRKPESLSPIEIAILEAAK